MEHRDGKSQPLHLQSARRVSERGRGSAVGKRQSLGGDSRAAPAGMFPFSRWGRAELGAAAVPELPDQSGKCVLGFWLSLGRLRSPTSGRQGLQRSGEDSPGLSGEGWRVGSALRRSRSPWSSPGLRALPPRQKPQAWAPRAGCFWHQTGQLFLAMPGRGRGQATLPGESQDGSGIPGFFLPVNEGNTDLSC